MDVSGSTTAFESLPKPRTAALTQFPSEPQPLERRAAGGLEADRPSLVKRTKPVGAAPTEILFGSYRVLPTQFLLLEGDKPVPLGSRALEILIALLERPGELINKQYLMARVWPNIFVDPSNLTVHISALRRTLRDGQNGNRYIINIPGRGYSFVASVEVSGHETRRERWQGHPAPPADTYQRIIGTRNA